MHLSRKWWTRSSRGLPVRTASDSRPRTGWPRGSRGRRHRAGRDAGSLRRRPTAVTSCAGHGGLPVLRASTAGPLTTRRLPGTSRAQAPDANDLDRPDPEIIPAGFGDSGILPRETAVADRPRPISGQDLGLKQPGRAVLLHEGVNDEGRIAVAGSRRTRAVRTRLPTAPGRRVQPGALADPRRP